VTSTDRTRVSKNQPAPVERVYRNSPVFLWGGRRKMSHHDYSLPRLSTWPNQPCLAKQLSRAKSSHTCRRKGTVGSISGPTKKRIPRKKAWWQWHTSEIHQQWVVHVIVERWAIPHITKLSHTNNATCTTRPWCHAQAMSELGRGLLCLQSAQALVRG
jgi:hypothetical protein